MEPELASQATPQNAKVAPPVKISNDQPETPVEAKSAPRSVAPRELEDTPDPAAMRALKSQGMAPSKLASPEVHWTKWVLDWLIYM